jgi:hypothetical protein
VRTALAQLGFDGAPRLFATILRTDSSLRRTWGAGPAIRDGFRSLEALQVNAAVQRQHPRSTWTRPKESLVLDEADVLETLRASAPGAVVEVERLWSDPRQLSATMPPWYFPPSGPR